ncbi:ABC transporter permease [Emticicia sp. BO119]|uniref:ABC transporter permease n=1 Tax=Emticicia sp. BO119 TaxID=2757768 RepID=UPI0015F0B4D2|nr:ABC transporter permease [Emticicia sp. BO119]MBA4850879.1 ABC transporter permease [Emticicia sp. BO119]
MIRNYLKLGLRNLLKNRLSSIINICGLGLAVGCCLVVAVFLDWSFFQDTFHSKLDKLYVVEKIALKDGNEEFRGDSPAPIAEMLKNEFPQIKNSARIDFEESIIKEGDNVFRESISFVDDSFYDMFDFPVKWGNTKTFTEPNSIVLTEELSEKLYGKANTVGKNLNVRFNVNGREIVENFTIKGVFEKRPFETSFYFSALIPFQKMASLGININDDWSRNVDMTFIETENDDSGLPNELQSKKYLNLYNAANKDNKILKYHFQALKTMNLHSYKLGSTRFNNTHIIGLVMLISIAIAILLLVCFNFMNIAVASASNRLKEIGVRKVMGSNRKQIIFQFILENLILCTVGVGFGLLLANMLFLPWFSRIAGFDLTQKFLNNSHIWMTLLALIILTVLGGAAYPSFYISSLKPISIVKGSMALGSKNRFRKMLLGFQFFLTFLGISMALAFVQENKISRAKSWGYDPTNNVVVKLDVEHGFDVLNSELRNNVKVQSLSGTTLPLEWAKEMVIKVEGQDYQIKGLKALPNFANTMGISIINGRDLSDAYQTDKTTSVLVNQTFLKRLNWKTGIGKTVEYENKKYLIVGEMKDFHYENFEHTIQPLMLMGCGKEEVKYAYVKTEKGLLNTAHLIAESVWRKAFPNVPFDYYYQDTVFDNYYYGFTQVIQILSAASFIMIIVSITGIFGLALLILSKKMKEISVRKVLGAGMGNIGYQIVKEFLFAIGIAFIIGVPISYLLTKAIFGQVTPESQVSFLPLVATLAGLVLMTIFSVSWHLYKAFVANPTEFLKDN